MTETDDHGGRGHVDRLIRSPVLDDLETAYGVKCAFSACDVGGFRLGCVRLEDDPDKPVALIVPDGKDWRVVARFEWSPPALRAIGPLLDERWDEVPVDRPGIRRPPWSSRVNRLSRSSTGPPKECATAANSSISQGR